MQLQLMDALVSWHNMKLCTIATVQYHCARDTVSLAVQAAVLQHVSPLLLQDLHALAGVDAGF